MRFLLLFVSSTVFAAAPWAGKQRAAVLLVEWSDRSSSVSAQTVEDTFFGTKNLSLRRFFQENSQGAFDLTGQIFGWQQVAARWSGFNGCNVKSIAATAWKAFNLDIKKFDADQNGKIDHLFVVHSGRIAHDRVGPLCMFTSHPKADQVAVFQAQGVGSKGGSIGLGFYLHEAGHYFFRLPDLYGRHYNGRYGIGMWGMMGLGAWGVNNQTSKSDLFRYPAHFEPKSKDKMGWGKKREISQSTRNVELPPIEKTGQFIKLPRDYYLEYRSAHGFSQNHHGHGLLVWQGFKIIQADGRDDINNGRSLGRRPLPPISENFGDDSDPFPGSQKVTLYEDLSAGLRLENIRIEKGKVKLDIGLFSPTSSPDPSASTASHERNSQRHL